MRRLVGVFGLALCACGPVVDIGPGTDADTGDPDGSTTDMTATTATTEMMTTAGPSTTVLDTSASDTVSTTVEPTTDEPPPPIDEGYCLPACDQPIDCCMGEPTCESMLGTYPYAYGCENGSCTYGGCTSDEDCTFGGVLMGWICTDQDGYAICAPSCETDQECIDQFLEGWVCNGTYCVQQPCASDVDCPEGTACNPESGTCTYPCDDTTCAGFGHCDPETGGCVCSSDAECPEGYGCGPLPN